VACWQAWQTHGHPVSTVTDARDHKEQGHAKLLSAAGSKKELFFHSTEKKTLLAVK